MHVKTVNKPIIQSYVTITLGSSEENHPQKILTTEIVDHDLTTLETATEKTGLSFLVNSLVAYDVASNIVNGKETKGEPCNIETFIPCKKVVNYKGVFNAVHDWYVKCPGGYIDDHASDVREIVNRQFHKIQMTEKEKEGLSFVALTGWMMTYGAPYFTVLHENPSIAEKFTAQAKKNTEDLYKSFHVFRDDTIKKNCHFKSLEETLQSVVGVPEQAASALTNKITFVDENKKKSLFVLTAPGKK